MCGLVLEAPAYSPKACPWLLDADLRFAPVLPACHPQGAAASMRLEAAELRRQLAAERTTLGQQVQVSAARSAQASPSPFHGPSCLWLLKRPYVTNTSLVQQLRHAEVQCRINVCHSASCYQCTKTLMSFPMCALQELNTEVQRQQERAETAARALVAAEKQAEVAQAAGAVWAGQDLGCFLRRTLATLQLCCRCKRIPCQSTPPAIHPQQPLACTPLYLAHHRPGSCREGGG